MVGDPPQDPRIGTTLKGKYRLDQLIGQGGMASVYRGTHRNGNPVAVKLLHPHCAINSLVQERFLREGYVANKVGHRGAVRVLDDDIAEDGAPFLVMELLEGETLDARLERTPSGLPPRDVVSLSLQVLDVLIAAHAQGIVHRDLKPENLFITSDGQIKVLDFGIARLREPDAISQTRTGTTMGTPAFMAPEQALGSNREIDGQTDLWAIGATMFTLFSGCYVHEAENGEAMRVYAGSRAARSLAVVMPTLDPAIVGVIDTALKFDKRERFPNVATMRSALLVVLEAWDTGRPSLTTASGAPSSPSAAPSSASLSALSPSVLPAAAASGARMMSASTSAPVIRAPSSPPHRSVRAVIRSVTAGVVVVAAIAAFTVVGKRHDATAISPPVTAAVATAQPGLAPNPPTLPMTPPAEPGPAPSKEEPVSARPPGSPATPEQKPLSMKHVVPVAPKGPPPTFAKGVAATPTTKALAPPEKPPTRAPANALDLQIK